MNVHLDVGYGFNIFNLEYFNSSTAIKIELEVRAMGAGAGGHAGHGDHGGKKH